MQNLLLCLLLLPLLAFAQKREVFRIDSLPKGGVLLNQGWKWHAGDNQEWAKAEFDDAGWEEIDPTKNVVQLANITTDRPLWLRIKLSHKAAKVYALSISQSGASEIYLNGRLTQKIGQIAPGNQRSRAYNPLNDYFILKLDSLDNTLAIRYYFQQGLNLNPIYNIRYPLFSTRIFDDKYLLASSNSSLWLGFEAGVYLILFLIHGILFLYYPPLKANFWYSVWAFLYTIFVYFLILLGNNPYLERNTQYVFLALVLNQLFSFCMLYCIYLLLENKWRVYIFLFLAVGFANITIYYLVEYETREILELVSILLHALLFVSMALNANRAGDRGGMLVLYGTLAYVIFWVLFMTSYLLSWSQISNDILFHLSTLSFPITVSTLLGIRFRKVNLAMLHNLEQVNQLYSEKQQLLATQNETLERQVKARTAELNQSLETLQSTQAQLIQSEKLASLGELTAGIAHEIQNPLNFVNNFAEVSAEMLDEMHEELEKGDTTEAIAIATDLKTNLEKINHHGQRASSIVKGMLEHSRASTGVKEPTDLNALADEYLRLAYHGLRAKDSNFNATLETHFDPDLPLVSVIPQDIGRVLLNLINNAFYAVAERSRSTVGAPLAGAQPYEPTVTVRTKKLENAIEVRVQDNGNGIPEAIRDKIFQPFFTTKPTGQGTGLGLSLAYDIVTKGHGGSLELDSTEGTGTVFIVRLTLI